MCTATANRDFTATNPDFHRVYCGRSVRLADDGICERLLGNGAMAMTLGATFRRRAGMAADVELLLDRIPTGNGSGSATGVSDALRRRR